MHVEMKNRLLQCVIVIVLLLGSVYSACPYSDYFTTRLVVVYRAPGCTHFIAEGPNYYSIMEWRDGYDPAPGDILLGDFKNTGYTDAYYPVPDGKGAVRVCSGYLSWGEAITKYYKICPY
jgi:hypothetical protein